MLWVLTLIVLAVSASLYPRAWTLQEFGLGAYLSVVWTLPTLLSVMAVIGAVQARRSLTRPIGLHVDFHCDELLIVQVPTIGRTDVMPALRRVVESMEAAIPANFTRWRVDVVAEESSEARDELEALNSENVRVLYVPGDYTTPNGTQAKARANCWLDELRQQEGESREDVWVLHMDDDTAIGPDTAEQIARSSTRIPPVSGATSFLAQGVLTYPRQFSSNGVACSPMYVRAPTCPSSGSGPAVGDRCWGPTASCFSCAPTSSRASVGTTGARCPSRRTPTSPSFATRHPGVRRGWPPGATAAPRSPLRIWSSSGNDGRAVCSTWRATAPCHCATASC